MKLTAFQNVKGFLALVQPLLEAEEARNNLMLSICLTIDDYNRPDGLQNYLACVQEDRKVRLAAVMTPPYNLVLFSPLDEPPAAAIDALIDDLEKKKIAPPGAHGIVNLVVLFAQHYAARSGSQTRCVMRQRAYELTRVTRTNSAPGAMRQAALDDLPKMLDMFTRFAMEAVPNDPRDQIERKVRTLIEREWLFFWEVNGQPAAIAGGVRPTTHGITIGAVYTPPDLRRRGYASALVAELSQHFLDAGRQFCSLFTDLNNPTSNHIYQQIGYRPVGDFNIYLFE